MKKRTFGILCVLFGLFVLAAAIIITPLLYGAGFFLLFAALLGVCCTVFGFTFLPRSNTRLGRATGWLRRLMIVGFLLWLVSLLVVEGFIINNRTPDRYQGEKYLLVLGAGLRGEEPSLALVYRLRTAKEFLEEHPDTIAVLCGSKGPGESITEAEAMRRWLIDEGIPDHRLILEDASHNTIQNIGNAVMLIKKRDGVSPNKVMIVTNDFHIWRSKLIAERIGIAAGGVPAPTPTIHLVSVSLYLREYFSLVLFLFR